MKKNAILYAHGGMHTMTNVFCCVKLSTDVCLSFHFYSKIVQTGELAIKYDAEGNVVLRSKPREVREFNGRKYIMEEAITGDYSLVKAWKGDAYGNLVFKGSAMNFNPVMAKGSKNTIAEVKKICVMLFVCYARYQKLKALTFFCYFGNIDNRLRRLSPLVHCAPRISTCPASLSSASFRARATRRESSV